MYRVQVCPHSIHFVYVLPRVYPNSTEKCFHGSRPRAFRDFAFLCWVTGRIEISSTILFSFVRTQDGESHVCIV
jgi:hypothetical protein